MDSGLSRRNRISLGIMVGYKWTLELLRHHRNARRLLQGAVVFHIELPPVIPAFVGEAHLAILAEKRSLHDTEDRSLGMNVQPICPGRDTSLYVKTEGIDTISRSRAMKQNQNYKRNYVYATEEYFWKNQHIF
jgi:hypothetical protein